MEPKHMNPEPSRNPVEKQTPSEVAYGTGSTIPPPGMVGTAGPARPCYPFPGASRRQSAGNALRDRAAFMRRQADRLEVLAGFADALPPGSPAEEALWQEIMFPTPRG